jgi:putative ABC transport system substrate-binding protein
VTSRREFITLVGGAAAWPLATEAQQSSLPVIGWLSPGSRDRDQLRLDAFERGLQESRVEAGTVRLIYRFAEDHNDRLPALAADLVGRHVQVIAAVGAPAARAGKDATPTTPIVFVSAVDPVALGLVSSLSRPGSNITGVTDLTIELVPKQLEILRELAPSARRIGLLVNPENPGTEPPRSELTRAAHVLGLEIEVLHVRSETDLHEVFARLPGLEITAVIVVSDAFFNSRSEQIAKLAGERRLPALHNLPQFPRAGGLVSYGGGLLDGYRQIGMYAGRILKGEKPTDLPVMQSTKFELVINLRTARALGLAVPLSLLGRADEVIE